ncbi:MAG: molybdopterin molybdenumtransferase MoeA, partial [Sphingomonadaceae bacterium]|nr:molybdopterin molybdenumtransferase MoeA [Sphingomonadaceae bacterium]
MISFDDALDLIEAHVAPLGTEVVDLREAAGRVLAEGLKARMASPRHAVAAMDGYAVLDGATQPDTPLRLIGESRAGAGFTGSVSAGEAVRIFTGAPMPDGADRCIMQEYATRDGEYVTFAAG